MATNKKSFILYNDMINQVEKLNNEEAGELFKLILRHSNCQDTSTENRIVDLMFEPVKNILDRDLVKWEEQLEQRSEAGKRSAELRKQKALGIKDFENKELTTQRDSTSVESRSTIINECQRDSTDNVSVSDSVSVNDINKELLSEPSSDAILLIDLVINKNSSQELKITKAFFDLFRDIQAQNGVTVFNQYDKTKTKSWLTHVNRMLTIDKIQIETLKEVYAWLKQDNLKQASFWRKNMHSIESMRKHFPRLQTEMNTDLKTIVKQQTQVRKQSNLGL